MSLPTLAILVLAMGLLYTFLRKRAEHEQLADDTHRNCSGCVGGYPALTGRRPTDAGSHTGRVDCTLTPEQPSYGPPS